MRWMYAASMAIFGTLAPFVRNIGLSSGALALCRAVLGAGLIGCFLILRGKNPFSGGFKGDGLLLLLSGAAMGINWILLFEAYRYTTVSTATLCYYFAPILVTALSPLLFREKLTKRQLICFVMATLGLVLITGTESGGSWKGILFGLGAACFYAGVILLNKFIRGVDGIRRTFLQFLSAIVILIPYVLGTGGVALGNLNGTGWLCLLIVGLFHTGITYCMYFSSLKAIPGQQAAIFSYIDPVTAVLVSVLLLREPLTLTQAMGGILVLGFTLWNALPERND